MESRKHRELRYRVGSILKKHGWTFEYTGNGLRGVDIIAKRWLKTVMIEIETTGGNIGRDLENGAQIFVVQRRDIHRVSRKVKRFGSRAPVVTSGEFEKMISGLNFLL